MKLLKAFISILLIFLFSISTSATYEYLHDSGLSFRISNDISITHQDQTLIQIAISDNSSAIVSIVDISDFLSSGETHTISEDFFYSIAEVYSISSPPHIAKFSDYEFYLSEESVSFKLSYHELIKDMTYDEYVSFFGDEAQSELSFIVDQAMPDMFPGSESNPYYYFDYIDACVVPKYSHANIVYAFVFNGTKDDYPIFQSLLNSITFPSPVETDLHETLNSSTSTKPVDTNRSSLFEKFVVGSLSASVFLVAPQLWNYGKKLKNQSIVNGKIYYGVLYYRFVLLCLAGFMSAEMILLPIIGDSLEDTPALIPALLFSIPVTVLYVRLYKKYFTQKHLSKTNSDIDES